MPLGLAPFPQLVALGWGRKLLDWGGVGGWLTYSSMYGSQDQHLLVLSSGALWQPAASPFLPPEEDLRELHACWRGH